MLSSDERGRMRFTLIERSRRQQEVVDARKKPIPWNEYRQMGPGVELKVTQAGRRRVVASIRAKTPSGLVRETLMEIPVVGYSMMVDISFAGGTPSWPMRSIIEKLTCEFSVNPRIIHIVPAGDTVNLGTAYFMHSSGSKSHRTHTIDTQTERHSISAAYWAAEYNKPRAKSARVIHKIFLWTALAQNARQQAELYKAITQSELRLR